MNYKILRGEFKQDDKFHFLRFDVILIILIIVLTYILLTEC